MYIRDGKTYSSRQHYKKSLPELSQERSLFVFPRKTMELLDVTIGMVLGDATMYISKKQNPDGAYIKFEQGIKQEAFINHLFELYRWRALLCNARSSAAGQLV